MSYSLVQQHSLDQVVVYKYPSYQWDHAVTLSVERREEERRGERKRARREIAHITLLYMILIQLQHTHTHTISVIILLIRGIRRLMQQVMLQVQERAT